MKSQKDIKIALYFLIMTCIVSTQRSYPTYQQYSKLYNKTWYSDSERQLKQQVYQKNIEKLQQITQYQPGVNEMTDWTEQEINERKNLQTLDTKDRLKRAPPAMNRVSSPRSFDWRSSGVITQVKDQGKCGSCWAFAAIAYAQSRLIIDKRFKSNTINLAQQYVISCSRYSSCSGGYLQYSMKTALKVPSQSTFPYNPFYAQSNSICSSDGLRIASNNFDYYDLSDSQIIALLLQSPVSISISSNNWQKYGSGIFKCPQNSSVNHAVQLVGYTDTYWIIKNQWGPRWGQNGFIRVTRQRSRNCGIGSSVHTMRGVPDTSDDNKYIFQSNQTSSSNNNSGAVLTNPPTNTTLNQLFLSISKILIIMLGILCLLF